MTAGHQPAAGRRGLPSDLDVHPGAILQQVYGVREAHHARLVAERHRMGAGSILEELHAPQQVAVGNPRSAEDDILARREVLRRIDLPFVRPHLLEALALLVVARPEARLDLAAQALQGGGSQYPLRCPAGAHHRVDVRAAHRRRQGSDDIAVAYELHTHSRFTYLADELCMAGTIENHHRQVLQPTVQAHRHRPQVRRGRPGEVNLAGCRRANYQLLHVGVGGLEEAAFLCQSDHRHRVVDHAGGDAGSLYGVDGDVHRPVPLAAQSHPLAYVEHGRLVAFALANDDLTVDVQLVQHLPHRVSARLVDQVRVALSRHAAGRYGGLLGDADGAHDQRPLHLGPQGAGTLRHHHLRLAVGLVVAHLCLFLALLAVCHDGRIVPQSTFADSVIRGEVAPVLAAALLVPSLQEFTDPGEARAALVQQDGQVEEQVGRFTLQLLVLPLQGSHDRLARLLDHLLRRVTRAPFVEPGHVGTLRELGQAPADHLVEEPEGVPVGVALAPARQRQVAVEAGALTGVAGRALLHDRVDDRVAVAVEPDARNRLGVAAALALAPEGATRAAEVVRLTAFQREAQGLAVGVCEHQHLAAVRLLGHHRHQAALVELDLVQCGAFRESVFSDFHGQSIPLPPTPARYRRCRSRLVAAKQREQLHVVRVREEVVRPCEPDPPAVLDEGCHVPRPGGGIARNVDEMACPRLRDLGPRLLVEARPGRVHGD